MLRKLTILRHKAVVVLTGRLLQWQFYRRYAPVPLLRVRHARREPLLRLLWDLTRIPIKRRHGHVGTSAGGAVSHLPFPPPRAQRVACGRAVTTESLDTVFASNNANLTRAG